MPSRGLSLPCLEVSQGHGGRCMETITQKIFMWELSAAIEVSWLCYERGFKESGIGNCWYAYA